MTQRKNSILVIIGTWVGLLVLILAFQNCGAAKYSFEDLESTAEAAFFSYPFKSAPAFYSEIRLFTSSGTVSGLASMKLIAAVAQAEATQVATSINYEVKIQNTNGQNVCPTETGILLAEESAIEFDCVATQPVSNVKVLLMLSNGQDSEVIEKTF